MIDTNESCNFFEIIVHANDYFKRKYQMDLFYKVLYFNTEYKYVNVFCNVFPNIGNIGVSYSFRIDENLYINLIDTGEEYIMIGKANEEYLKNLQKYGLKICLFKHNKYDHLCKVEFFDTRFYIDLLINNFKTEFYKKFLRVFVDELRITIKNWKEDAVYQAFLQFMMKDMDSLLYSNYTHFLLEHTFLSFSDEIMNLYHAMTTLYELKNTK